MLDRFRIPLGWGQILKKTATESIADVRSDVVLDEEAEAEILDRLRALGYVE